MATLPIRTTWSSHEYARLLGVNASAQRFCTMMDSPKKSSSELPSTRPGATPVPTRSSPRTTPRYSASPATAPASATSGAVMSGDQPSSVKPQNAA